MKRELDYFRVDGAYGWCQDQFPTFMMRLGGCAIVTACDSCIYLKKYRHYTSIYPFQTDEIRREDYIRFSKLMHPYLHPRWQGVNTLKLYLDGLGQYLQSVGEHHLHLEGLEGTRPVDEAQAALIAQLDAGLPVPCLILKHQNVSLKDYVWHWFLLTGYEQFEGTFLVKAVSYGSWQWLDLGQLWDTGYRQRGGLILFREGIGDHPA